MIKHLSSKVSSDGSENGICFNDVSSNTQQPQPHHKKQVRRRLHTTKPYQQRLLNMAEARREIVTALKYHRASMKQQEVAAAAVPAAATNHHHSPQLSFCQEKKAKSRAIISLYPPTTANATTANSHWPMSTFSPPPPPPPPLPSYHDNINFTLPNQPLGLNLNYQYFTNLDTNIYHKPFSIYLSSSGSSSASSSWNPSSSSSPALSTPLVNPSSSSELHHIMDGDSEEYDHGFHQFDENMEVPPWLINANESSCMQQHFDDHFSNVCFQDPALPRMEIGEIEAIDGEWLA